MAKYLYPAIFTPEKNGAYSVDFPDLEGCYTCGDNLADAMTMAEDVLAFTMYGYERDHKPIPIPSDTQNLTLLENEFTNLIVCDTMEYQKRNNTASVKKTLTIPEWLNEAAIAAGLNFSQVLQNALKQQLNL